MRLLARVLLAVSLFATAAVVGAILDRSLIAPAQAQASCPTPLPPAVSFTAANATQGQFKTALTNLVSYLGCLFGTDGSAASARAALGLSTVAVTGSYNDLSNLPSLTLGGDLSGGFGSVSVDKIKGRGVSGAAPTGGQALIFLGGTGLWTPSSLAVVATTGNYSDLIGAPTAFTPSGPAGGALGGTYPNPSLSNTGVSAGFYNVFVPSCADFGGPFISGISVGVDGRISGIGTASVPGCPSGGGGGGG